MNSFAVIVALLLAGCSHFPPELNNLTADEAAWLSKNPEAAQVIAQRAIPQDDQLHWSMGAQQLHDKIGNPIGWEFDTSVKFAWPLHEPIPHAGPVIKRPRVPAKTYPP